MKANTEVGEMKGIVMPLYLWGIVLVLAGTELFVEACVVLCFGFLTKRVVIRTAHFSYFRPAFTQPQRLLCFSCYSPSEWAGVHKRLGGNTARTADPR